MGKRGNALTDDKKDEIRRLRAAGRTYREIAKIAGCDVASANRYGSGVRLDPAILVDGGRVAAQKMTVARAPPTGHTARPAWFDEDIDRMLRGR